MLEMGSCPGLYPPEVKMFWYELTDYDVQEFEEKEEVRVTWRYDRGTSIPGTSSTIEKPENCPAWMATKVSISSLQNPTSLPATRSLN